jgi:hypothetical protein
MRNLIPILPLMFFGSCMEENKVNSVYYEVPAAMPPLSVAPVFPASGEKTGDHSGDGVNSQWPANIFSRQFYFIVENEYIVLGLGKGEWTSGDAVQEENTEVPLFVKEIKEGVLPDSITRLDGQLFDAFTPSGEVVRVKINGFKCMERSFDYFESAWENDNSVLLVGVIEAEYDTDTPLVGALIPSSVPPMVYQEQAPDLNREFWRSLKRTKTYQHAQADYVKVTKTTGVSWLNEADTITNCFSGPANSTFTFLSGNAGTGCGEEFYGSIAAMIQTDSSGNNSILYESDDGFRVLALFDMEGDGMPEILMEYSNGTRTVLRKNGETWDESAILYVIDNRCPC